MDRNGRVMNNSVEIKNLQPLVIAMVGDSVHTLFVRERLAVANKYKVNTLSKEVAKRVNAGSQCKMFFAVEKCLTEEEMEIAKRARNTHIHSKAKNYSATEYIHATAFESVLGYLYLTKQFDRLNEILEIGEQDYANRG